MLKKLMAATLISLVAASGFARPYNDVSIYIIPETVLLKFKKNPAISVSFSTSMTYYSDSSEPSKAKATGRVWFYVSNDASPSLDDRFIQSKTINLKDQKEKILKAKLNLTAADMGKYLVAVIDSPQDIQDGPSYHYAQIPYLI